jgi:hypothetical protein
MAGRSMTAGEQTLATTVYKNQIDYSKVTIYNEKWAFFQPTNRAMSPNGNIYYPQGNTDYSSDFSAAGVTIHQKATFIHELAHVWQHQHGVNVIARGIFQRDYDYLPLTTATNFNDLGLEEQAQLIRDYYYLLNNYHGKNWPPISVYIHVIPFLP